MTDGDQRLLSVRDLTTGLRGRAGEPVVKRISFDVAPGETVALVGESGSGKTMAMLSVMGLEPQAAEVIGGEVCFEGRDLLRLPEHERRSIRGRRMAMVYQDPMTSLNPMMRVGAQIEEGLLAHGVERRDAAARVVEVLGEVGIPQPSRAARAYPHEFSGGMRQRVVIAMALALRPRLLIADEPTTALDVTIQQQIVALVARLQAQNGMAVVWITHDLGVVARVASRMLVMYAGHLVEQGETRRVFSRPEHPYTAALIGSIPPVRGAERPPLLQIGGSPPDPTAPPSGCPFHPRCPQAVDVCPREMPPLTARGGSSAACHVPPEEWRP